MENKDITHAGYRKKWEEQGFNPNIIVDSYTIGDITHNFREGTTEEEKQEIINMLLKK